MVETDPSETPISDYSAWMETCECVFGQVLTEPFLGMLQRISLLKASNRFQPFRDLLQPVFRTHKTQWYHFTLNRCVLAAGQEFLTMVT